MGIATEIISRWELQAEKDAGEPFFALHNEKGYDYYSTYFSAS